MMRSIGMDVHRSFAQVAICDDGQITDSFKVDMEHDAVVEFGRSLRADDEVVLEATGNTATIVRLLTPFVARVVIANPLQVKAIAHARVKTDKVDAKILAQLHAAGFLPEVWAADDETLALRRLVSERAAVVRSIRRSKSRVQAVLHANLIPKYAGHLFGKGGRRWLAKAPLPKTERDLLERHLDELDWLAGRLETLERDLIHISLDDPQMRKLMAVAGISSVIATAVIASIGDISRFATPGKLASYFGLTPRVRQSGAREAIHGRITQGNATARTMLVEAAWGAASVPGPLRAFFLRQRSKGRLRRLPLRAKLQPIWHLLTKDAPYQWARPAFVAMKMRKLELRAGAPKAYGKAGPGRDYWIKELRHREMELVANAEASYAKMVEASARKATKDPKNLRKGLFNNIRVQLQSSRCRGRAVFWAYGPRHIEWPLPKVICPIFWAIGRATILPDHRRWALHFLDAEQHGPREIGPLPVFPTIQCRNPLDGLLGNGGTLCGKHIDKLASDVGHAGHSVALPSPNTPLKPA